MTPMFGREMAKARAADLIANGGWRERPRRERDPSPRRGWRLSLGVRLVSAGFRLLGEQVEAR